MSELTHSCSDVVENQSAESAFGLFPQLIIVETSLTPYINTFNLHYMFRKSVCIMEIVVVLIILASLCLKS